MKKRKIALIMAFVLVVQMLPLPAGAMAGVFGAVSQSEAAGVLSDTDGNITWSLTVETAKDGWMLGNTTPYKLTLSGTGVMKDYKREEYTVNNKSDDRTSAPWKEYASQIQTISIGNGITNISSYAFYKCNSALSVDIPNSVTGIGYRAFQECSALKQVTLPEGVRRRRIGRRCSCRPRIRPCRR